MQRLFRALSVLGMIVLMSAGLTGPAGAAEQPGTAVILAHGGAPPGTDQPVDPMSGMDMGGGNASSMPRVTASEASTGSMPGMIMPGPAGTSHGSASTPPRGLVIGGFAVLNVGVLLGAARLRRHGKTTRPRRAAHAG